MTNPPKACNSTEPRNSLVKSGIISLFASVLFLCTVPAQAASVTSNYLEQTYTDTGGIGNNSVSSGPATVPSTQLTQSNSETSTATLYGSGAWSTFHGYVQSIASVSSPGAGVSGPITYSNLGFIAADDLLFTSSTLAVGTPVTFELTVDLHSILSADSAGTCSGQSPTPAGFASLSMIYNNGNNYGAFMFTPLNHNTCGGGSDSMSFDGTFQSEVGNGAVSSNDPGDFAIQTYFTLNSQAHVVDFAIGSDTTTVDAGSTGEIYVQVLTPGVTFSSSSGATYSAAPEPGTFQLLGLSLLILGRAIRRR